MGGGAASAPAPIVRSEGGASEAKAGAMAYLTFVPAVCLLCMERHKESRFVRFHAIQCVALTLSGVATLLVLELVGVFGRAVSVGVAVIFVAAWIVGVVKASKGEMYELPLVGELATKRCKARDREVNHEIHKYRAA